MCGCIIQLASICLAKLWAFNFINAILDWLLIMCHRYIHFTSMVFCCYGTHYVRHPQYQHRHCIVMIDNSTLLNYTQWFWFRNFRYIFYCTLNEWIKYNWSSLKGFQCSYICTNVPWLINCYITTGLNQWQLTETNKCLNCHSHCWPHLTIVK